MDLHEYHRELTQSVASDADDRGGLKEDAFFERFTAALIDAGEIAAADRVLHLGPVNSGIRVDGYGGDPKDRDWQLTLFVMDYHVSDDVSKLTRSDMEAILKKALKFLKKAREASWRQGLEEVSPGYGLATLIAERWPHISQVKIVLLTNRELSERVDSRAGESEDGKPVAFAVFDLQKLYRLETSNEPEPILIDFEEFGSPLPVLSATQPGAPYQSYLLVVPGPTLARIYERWGTRLLEQNVRVFLQARGKVNRKIQETISNEPHMFFAYNNGLCATAVEIELSSQDSGVPFLRRVRNLQIVNGGQTTASLHYALRRKVSLEGVSVQVKLTVISGEDAQNVVPAIARYANNQNKISDADFFSNHPFHVRVEQLSRRLFAPAQDGKLRETKWFYERARGQYQEVRAKLTAAEVKSFEQQTPKAQVFTKTDLAKSENTWACLPHLVSEGAQKNFAKFAETIGKDWDRTDTNFNEVWYRQAVARIILFRKVEKLVSQAPWYPNGYRANIVTYGIAKAVHEVTKRGRVIDLDSVWKKQDIPGALADFLTEACRIATKVIVNKAGGNITEWAKTKECWEAVKVASMTVTEESIAAVTASKEDINLERREARATQAIDNEIDAQADAVRRGAAFWKGLQSWLLSRNLIRSPSEQKAMTTLCAMPARLPSPSDCVTGQRLLALAREKGFNNA